MTVTVGTTTAFPVGNPFEWTLVRPDVRAFDHRNAVTRRERAVHVRANVRKGFEHLGGVRTKFCPLHALRRKRIPKRPSVGELVQQAVRIVIVERRNGPFSVRTHAPTLAIC